MNFWLHEKKNQENAVGIPLSNSDINKDRAIAMPGTCILVW